MNKCIICQKDISYPDGVYLKSGKEVHIICLQKKKDLLKCKNTIKI